jgi:hypothetical protein
VGRSIHLNAVNRALHRVLVDFVKSAFVGRLPKHYEKALELD